jgi:acyl dehydratase
MTTESPVTAMTTVDFADLESLVGKPLGATPAKDGPFGTTIAHGMLTVGLLIPLFEQLLAVQHVTTKINIGLNKVRLTAPVPVDSRIRLTATIASVAPTKGGGKEFVWDGVVQIEGAERPALVAQAVWRVLP